MLIGAMSWFKEIGDAMSVQGFVYGLPFVNGIAIAFSLAVFPVIVCMSLFPKGYINIVDFFKTVLYFKSWVIPVAIGMDMAEMVRGSTLPKKDFILTVIYSGILGAPVIAYAIIKAGNVAAGAVMGGGLANSMQQMGNRLSSGMMNMASSVASLATGIGGGMALGAASNAGGMVGKGANTLAGEKGRNMRGAGSRMGFSAGSQMSAPPPAPPPPVSDSSASSYNSQSGSTIRGGEGGGSVSGLAGMGTPPVPPAPAPPPLVSTGGKTNVIRSNNSPKLRGM
jgi:hypothetical protein